MTEVAGVHDGPRRIGEYVILRRLGKGASSDVFEARDARSGVHRALKLFSSPHRGDGFVREAGVALELRHPNLLSARDMGYLDSGTRYVAFDLAPGGSLRTRLGAARPSLAFVRHVVVELGRALTFLHGAGLVHRDLKPENVLLSGTEAFARVRLGDLGTCEAVRNGPARGDVGSPAYMAPEQIEGACDTRADVYALGVLAYEMVVGARPFVGTPKEVLEGHLRKAPSFAAVPGPLVPVLRRALAKAPDDRHARVDELVAELDRALARSREAVEPAGAAVDARELARDEASGWTARRISAANIGFVVPGAPRSAGLDLAMELARDGVVGLAASGLVRVVACDADATTFVGDDGAVRVRSSRYGLPPAAVVRRLAGDAVVVEGGATPAVSRFDPSGHRLSSSPLPIPVSSLEVVAMDDGEHVLAADLQRRSVVAVHALGHGRKAQVLATDGEIAALLTSGGRARVRFTSGAEAEICADGAGTFHLLGGSR